MLGHGVVVKMSKTKAIELDAALKNLREQKKKLQEEKKREQEERKRIREEKRLQKLELQLKKMDANERVDRQKERVILGVEARPCLWDKSCVAYKDRCAKEAGWKGVARELNLDVEKVKSMWNNLADQAREIWRNEVYHSGAGIDETIEESKTWKFYKSIEFFRKSYKFRRTDSNFKIIGCDSLSDSEDENVDVTPFECDNSSLTGFGDASEDENTGEQSQVPDPDQESQPSTSHSSNNSAYDSQLQGSQSSTSDVNIEVESTQTSTSNVSNTRVGKNQKSKVQSNSARKSISNQRPKERKRKNDDIDEKLLSHMELAAKALTEPDDPTEKFLSYLGENLRLVSAQKRKKCEQKLIELVNAYGDDECDVTVVVTPI